MTNRVAIYARFSSDLQDGRSIADQLALCREYAARQAWTIVATYTDHAVSGASIDGRPDFTRLIADAEARAFDVVLAEDVYRFSRDAADALRFHAHAQFIGIRVFTVADGAATKLLFGLKGLMGQETLDQLARNVRRGQQARLREGLAPGGRLYGYAPVPGKPGERAIVDDEAEVVRRIYREYAAGATPRQIAGGLNRDRVPAPRGTRWNASTLHGNAARGYGILVNPIYRGVLRWGRVSMVKRPGTNKRLSRINPADAWRDAPAPQLAIVPPDILAAVDARRSAQAHKRPEYQRRPRRLLSGLMRCAACGGGMSTAGQDKSGRTRLRCSTASESGTCPAPATFYLDAVESLVLSRLRTELRDPQVVAAYVKEYHAERARLAAGSSRRREAIERRLAQIDRDQARAVDVILQGIGDVRAIGDRSRALAAERDQLAAELVGLATPAPIVALHPAVLARLAHQVEQLQQSLAGTIAAGDAKAAHAIRALVESVTVRRDPARPGGLAVKIVGRLAALLDRPGDDAASAAGMRNAGSGGTLPAFRIPARFELIAAA